MANAALGADLRSCSQLAANAWRVLLLLAVSLLGALLPTPRAHSAEPIHPLAAIPGLDQRKVELGRRLFNDPKLSKDDTRSCSSCHNIAEGGDDGKRLSLGIQNREGIVNSLTVLNAALNFRQFWDGRAETLEEQIDGPVQNPAEMGSVWPDVVAKLLRDATYPASFSTINADGITRVNIKNAIAEFERSLIILDSPFDRWLGGDANAINTQEKRGYEKFKQYGCSSCHQGANVGGNMYQVFGVLNDYFKKRGNITEADLGRYNLTGNEADRHAFRVPSLRMAAHTAPYFHDGFAKTLRDAVNIMFEFQLGRVAADADKDDIVAFIKTLSGKLPGATQ